MNKEYGAIVCRTVAISKENIHQLAQDIWEWSSNILRREDIAVSLDNRLIIGGFPYNSCRVFCVGDIICFMQSTDKSTRKWVQRV